MHTTADHKNNWMPPDRLAQRELLVVAVTDHFFGENYGRNISFPDHWGLNLRCTFSTDRSLMEQADALWFHGPSVTGLPPRKSGQRWIMMCMESEHNYPFLRDQEIMDLFDLHMTYRLDSDIPTPYPNWPEYGTFMEQPLSFAHKSAQPASVLYAASHPVSYRDDYVRELMQFIAVDSIGKCLHNHDIPGFISGSGWPNNGFQALLKVIRNYKFYLTLENSKTQDYVTERVFMALVAGAVPVYLGAKNIRDFMPSDNAIICIEDFKSARELADFLVYLGNNEQAYQQHLAWKTDSYSEQFKALLDFSSINPLLRMFIKLAHECGRDCHCGGKMR